MTGFVWMQNSLEIPAASPEDGLVWVFRMDGLAAGRMLESLRPTRADLADAAQAREEDGAPRLLRRLLLRALAARLLGRHVDAVEIVRTARGGLMLPGCDLHANVSGSGVFAAIAVATQPVGVDMEMLGIGMETTEELRHWTALEAFIKSAGTGFGDAMPDYRYAATANGFAFGDGAARQRGEWFCTPDFIAAAATHSARAAV